jgi:hypothetical protein
MSDDQDTFIDIDTMIHDTIKFSDGSEVALEGSRIGEHRPLARVYFIPRLITNIISPDYLDKGNCDIHTKHNYLWICDDKRHIIA